MKNRTLLRKENQFLRVLKTNEDMVLVIDCVKKAMPSWVEQESMKDFLECEEQELLDYLKVSFEDKEKLSEKRRRVMNKRYAMLQGIIVFIGNQDLRSQAIALAEKEYKLSKQTIRYYLCQYLSLNDIRVLAPHERAVKPITEDEKNMRWALNRFYYNINKHTLKTAYTMLLKEKYCDGNGKLLEHYPSYYKFRYYFRKTKDLQKLHITREGLVNYQRNTRPLLGDGVTEFAPCIGTAMLDSTVCDIYLVNDTRQVVGRPILSACIDVYSGICMGYSLTWEGGTYNLRNLMLNVITDKKEHCRKFGINISTIDWNVSELPTRFVTDKGSEYKSENFEQISELGISIINLPPYRPELKGPVEKFFDCVQGYFKPYLKGKGVVEPDYQERGRHDYRKDASLTLEQFEKVLLHCILFYNTKRILEGFPFTEEMLEENINPYPNVLWNRGKELGAELIEVEAKELVKILLPRTKAKFRRNGLLVNGMRYKNENYNVQYLQGKDVVVAYNPDDVNTVWLLENGAYINFELIESRFKDKELTTVQEIKQKHTALCQQEHKNMTQAEIELAESILTIRNQALSQTKHTVKNIRQARQTEQQKLHKDFVREVM